MNLIWVAVLFLVYVVLQLMHRRHEKANPAVRVRGQRAHAAGELHPRFGNLRVVGVGHGRLQRCSRW